MGTPVWHPWLVDRAKQVWVIPGGDACDSSPHELRRVRTYPPMMPPEIVHWLMSPFIGFLLLGHGTHRTGSWLLVIYVKLISCVFAKADDRPEISRASLTARALKWIESSSLRDRLSFEDRSQFLCHASPGYLRMLRARTMLRCGGRLNPSN